MSIEAVPLRAEGRDRVTIVYIALAVVTCACLWLTSAAASGLFTPRGAAAAAAVIAVVKARFVVSDFMALRGTRAQPIFDAWLVAFGAIAVWLFLR